MSIFYIPEADNELARLSPVPQGIPKEDPRWDEWFKRVRDAIVSIVKADVGGTDASTLSQGSIILPGEFGISWNSVAFQNFNTPYGVLWRSDTVQHSFEIPFDSFPVVVASPRFQTAVDVVSVVVGSYLLDSELRSTGVNMYAIAAQEPIPTPNGAFANVIAMGRTRFRG